MRVHKASSNKKLSLAKILDLVAGGGLIILSLVAMALTMPGTHADEITPDSVSITLQTSCTMQGTVNTPHTTTVAPGVYTPDIGQTTIKTVCNDVSGFSLYAVGYTDDTAGKTVLASNIGSSYDIPTGTATSGSSNWAMKVNAVSGTSTPTIYGDYDNYHSVPDSYTKVAGYNGVTDSTNGSSVTTTYALYTTPSQMTGVYIGQVKYVMVHPATATGHTIVYNANGGTVSPASEIVPLGTSTTLPTPTQSGYNFLGWYTAATGGTKVGDAGDTYAPADNVVLHAQWEEQPADMQHFACSSINIGDTVTLPDARDGITYNVGKLADGKCWMLDNLAFNGKDNQGNGSYITMDSTNTHINTTKTWNDTIRTGWTSSSQNSYVASYINDASKDVVSSNAKDQAGQWKVGVYYNYCAATLDTICSSSTTTEASYDVCPKGWKMPAGDSSGDYQTLYSRSEYNTYDKYRDALRLPLSGYFYSGSPGNQGSYGLWWSTTASSSTSRYLLSVNTSGINPANGSSRRYGYSIRCISQ